MRVLIGTAILCAGVGAAACSSYDAPTSPASTNKIIDVVTSGETFLPTILGITAGDTVRWTFSVAADGLGHNILFKPRIAGAPDDIPLEVRSGTRNLVFKT